MFATAVIVFREVLEAALIVGIVAAATRSIPGRNRWLAAGIVAGLAGAGVVALGTERIAELASGMGQELFNAAVLGIAVVMLAWHNLWMSSHGAALAADARSVGNAIRDGRRECSVLLIVVGLAVLREGSETVLFLYGIAASRGQRRSLPMLAGGLVGRRRGRRGRLGSSTRGCCGSRCAGSSRPRASSCCSSPPAWRRRRRAS